jgi:hypothetical protein
MDNLITQYNLCDVRLDCEIPRFARNDTRQDFDPRFRLKLITMPLALSS